MKKKNLIESAQALRNTAEVKLLIVLNKNLKSEVIRMTKQLKVNTKRIASLKKRLK
jgi:L-asparaginase/Glu-tRNA(Gln) amidotransferase subunit D